MNVVVAITLLAFAILAVAIIYVESHERKGKGKSRKDVNCPGVVTDIIESDDKSIRNLFKWKALVSFEYEGATYELMLHYPSKPNAEVGKIVNVEVNTKDPKESNCNLIAYTEESEN